MARKTSDGTKVFLTPSADEVKQSGRRPDKWMVPLEEGRAKYGREMFKLTQFKGRERAYRVRTGIERGEVKVPGGSEGWDFKVFVRKCRGKETSHDGKVSELHARWVG